MTRQRNTNPFTFLFFLVALLLAIYLVLSTPLRAADDYYENIDVQTLHHHFECATAAGVMYQRTDDPQLFELARWHTQAYSQLVGVGLSLEEQHYWLVRGLALHDTRSSEDLERLLGECRA